MGWRSYVLGLASVVSLSCFTRDASAETSCSWRWDPEAFKQVYVCETGPLVCGACTAGTLVPALGTIPLGVLAVFDAAAGADPRRWRKGLLGAWALLGLIQVVSGAALIATNTSGDLTGAATWGSVGIGLGLPGAIVGTLGLMRGDRARAWPLEGVFASASGKATGLPSPILSLTAPGGGAGMTVGAAGAF